ncbi:MAG: DUF2162 domain-containing protein [Actinomycetota bacterium]|nr:DUF2162 domain-containing protein [Actinomycetota bacterium]MDI6821771.1 DUF2162 domain-containing protein [Actinomycetota bacterium]
MIAMLWRIGILSATIIFGIKIGLALGFSGLSRKVAILITCVYSLALLGLVILVSKHLNFLHKLASTYNYLIFITMSLIIFGAGLHTLREWKVHGKNKATTCCIALAAPCPCCYASVLMTIGLASPVIGVSSAILGKYTALVLGVTIFTTYFLSEGIVKLTKKPYPVLLGNLMLLVGFYFLASAIIMPNIASLQKFRMSPLTIPSIKASLAGVVFVIFLGVLGFYKSRKKSILR